MEAIRSLSPLKLDKAEHIYCIMSFSLANKRP
jgi:hypothetical protein